MTTPGVTVPSSRHKQGHSLPATTSTWRTHTKAGATTNKLCERGEQTLRMFGERGQSAVQCSLWTQRRFWSQLELLLLMADRTGRFPTTPFPETSQTWTSAPTKKQIQSDYKCSARKPGCENTNSLQINSCSGCLTNTSLVVATVAQLDRTQSTETALNRGSVNAWCLPSARIHHFALPSSAAFLQRPISVPEAAGITSDIRQHTWRLSSSSSKVSSGGPTQTSLPPNQCETHQLLTYNKYKYEHNWKWMNH